MKKAPIGYKAKHTPAEKDYFKLLANQIRDLRTKALHTNPALTGNQPATEPETKRSSKNGNCCEKNII
jgi:hypothetical protein